MTTITCQSPIYTSPRVGSCHLNKLYLGLGAGEHLLAGVAAAVLVQVQDHLEKEQDQISINIYRAVG